MPRPWKLLEWHTNNISFNIPLWPLRSILAHDSASRSVVTLDAVAGANWHGSISSYFSAFLLAEDQSHFFTQTENLVRLSGFTKSPLKPNVLARVLLSNLRYWTLLGWRRSRRSMSWASQLPPWRRRSSAEEDGTNNNVLNAFNVQVETF